MDDGAVKNRPLAERLGFAVAGLCAGWRRERSFRTHIGAAGLVLVALIVLQPAPVWWAIIAIAVCLVMALELINGAVETMADLLHPGIHPEVKVLKDMLAGAVLVVSVGAVCVAAALTWDRLPRILMLMGIER